jgi:membrane-bound lytic murein transglycosylase D
MIGSNELTQAMLVYLEMNAIIFVAWGTTNIAIFTREKFHLGKSSTWLTLANFLMVLSLILPLASLLVPKERLLRPSAQVWSSSASETERKYVTLTKSGTMRPAPDSISKIKSFSIEKQTFYFLLFFLALGACYRILKLFWDLRRLSRYLDSLPVIRKLGRVSILATDEMSIPFSAWINRQAFVVIPIATLSTHEYQIAIRHELQHHRQQDTLVLYYVELLKAFFFWNPAVYSLSHRLNYLQELACDECLIRFKKISPSLYGKCLIDVARAAISNPGTSVGTVSMAANLSERSLAKRVEMLFASDSTRFNRTTVSLFGLSAFLVMACVALAGTSAIQKRGLSLAEAEALVNSFSKDNPIPITVNEKVLEKLNKYIGTQEGRDWFKRAMASRSQFQALIERKTKEYGLPSDLIAVPLWESGFNNDFISSGYRAKGIWQFIAQTARRYHLTVSGKVDERTNPEKATDAAMRYLIFLHSKFHDWRLAIKAYNEGEERVQRLIKKHKTSDPWVLEKLDSKEGYLSGAVAMMILSRKPSLAN